MADTPEPFAINQLSPPYHHQIFCDYAQANHRRLQIQFEYVQRPLSSPDTGLMWVPTVQHHTIPEQISKTTQPLKPMNHGSSGMNVADSLSLAPDFGACNVGL